MTKTLPLTKQIELLLDYLSTEDKTENCIYKVTTEFKSQNGYITFEIGDIFSLCYLDVKYESYFVHKKVRGVIAISQYQLKNNLKIIGHPVMIGDVLEKIFNSNDLDLGFDKTKNILIGKWGNTAQSGQDEVFTKSLNEILREEIICCSCINPDCLCGEFPRRNDECRFNAEFKNPNTQKLLEFLWDLFEKDITIKNGPKDIKGMINKN